MMLFLCATRLLFSRSTYSTGLQMVNVSTKAFKRKQVRDSVIYDVASGTSRKHRSAHVFGLSATGALGLEQLMLSRDNGKSTPVIGVLHPLRLSRFGGKPLIPVKAACGYGFTLFICKNDADSQLSVYGCGINSDGQLGQLNTLRGILGEIQLKTDPPADDATIVHIVPTPTHIQLPVNAEEDELLRPSHMACGRAHSLIALQSPSSSHSSPLLFSLGNNVFGQCGRTVVDGEIFTPKSAMITRVVLPKGIQRIKQLCCGQDHSLILAEDGSVYSCGLGSDGQTGLGTLSSVEQFTPVTGAIQGVPIVQLASRGDTVLALASTGQLFAWGNNEYGQLWPAGDCLQVAEPMELPLNRCLVPPEANTASQSPSNVKIQHVQSIACAGSNCCLIDEAGQVFVWGFGCLGLGPDTTFTPLPTLVPPGLFIPANPGSLVSVDSGLYHYIVRNSTGQLWAWGAPRSGLFCLGLGRQLSDPQQQRQTFPLPISLPAEATQVQCGVDHTVVLTRGFV